MYDHLAQIVSRMRLAHCPRTSGAKKYRNCSPCLLVRDSASSMFFGRRTALHRISSLTRSRLAAAPLMLAAAHLMARRRLFQLAADPLMLAAAHLMPRRRLFQLAAAPLMLAAAHLMPKRWTPKSIRCGRSWPNPWGGDRWGHATRSCGGQAKKSRGGSTVCFLVNSK